MKEYPIKTIQWKEPFVDLLCQRTTIPTGRWSSSIKWGNILPLLCSFDGQTMDNNNQLDEDNSSILERDDDPPSPLATGTRRGSSNNEDGQHTAAPPPTSQLVHQLFFQPQQQQPQLPPNRGRKQVQFNTGSNNTHSMISNRVYNTAPDTTYNNNSNSSTKNINNTNNNKNAMEEISHAMEREVEVLKETLKTKMKVWMD